jgi:hypothetical protein
MEFRDWIDAVVAVISVASLVIAWYALRTARQAEERSRIEAKARVFLDLRDRFRTIKAELPAEWRNPHWNPALDDPDWKRLESYWQNAFDEWFVPTHLTPGYIDDLWELYFKKAVQSALTRPALRCTAGRLCRDGEFGAYNKEFQGVLEELAGRPLLN